MGWFVNNRQTILVVGGIALLAGSTILAIKAAPKAKDVLEKAKAEPIPDGSSEGKHKFRAYCKAGKCLIPSFATAVAGGAMIATGYGMQASQTAKTAAALAISEEARAAIEENTRVYRNNVVNAIGQEAEQKILEETKKEISEKPASNKLVIRDETIGDMVYLGNGHQLFKFKQHGGYFRSDWNTVEKTRLQLIQMAMQSDYTISLNDIWNEYCLSEQGELGEIVCVDLNRCGDIDFKTEACTTDNMEPYILIDIQNLSAKSDYRTLY